ncbi:MAG: diguanylate cyclase, partial [Desulfobacterales bacterium]|nr:diguanylate cyclase [Desulfobacterales bacterium]
KYWPWILTALSLFSVLAGFTVAILKLNRNIKASHVTLEIEVNERKRAERALHKANQELQSLAVLDALTQIDNRRSCDIHLDQEWRRLRREQAPLSLILCDIDYFKLYNDTYGHQAGDECLRLVARTIKQKVNRPADLAARYGGEEFVLILPNLDSKGAVSLAEAIRKEVQHLKIIHAQSNVGPYLTLSLGVAGIIPSAEFSPELLIKAADQALYQAKNLGRNRVVLKTIAT